MSKEFSKVKISSVKFSFYRNPCYKKVLNVKKMVAEGLQFGVRSHMVSSAYSDPQNVAVVTGVTPGKKFHVLPRNLPLKLLKPSEKCR